MAPLVLEGDTLGQKHHHYNRLVQEIIKNNSKPQEKLSLTGNDLDNLLKIDIASYNKDVDYILEVLKSEDMLYVSKAIKKSTWLITDNQYAHIVNPSNLYLNVFPEMTSRAINKFLLKIRLHLKDELRVNDFYAYLKDKNITKALKWLPNCSMSVIKEAIESHTDEFNVSLIKRLSEKSVEILELFIKKYTCYKKDYLKAATFLIHTDLEKYLDILESVENYHIPNFRKTATKIIMEKSPDRIVNNFDKYCNGIDLITFAKCLSTKDSITNFLLKQIENERLRNWFTYSKLKCFVHYMPKEGRFEFIKQIFIDKTHKKDTDELSLEEECCGYSPVSRTHSSMLCCAIEGDSSDHIYRWYRFAPFNVAFVDLKKLIRQESSPDERRAMLNILLGCARRNEQNVRTLLQYYHDKHINEPFKFKNQFISNVLTQTDSHKYDKQTWEILNEVLHSMEVYIESDNNMQSIIECIIVYKILHDEIIPEIIEKKFVFNSLKKFQKKLSNDEKDKIFTYLYKLQEAKLNNIGLSNETDANKAILLLQEIMSLLVDWKKDLIDFPLLIDKIRNLLKIKIEKAFVLNLDSLYNMKKAWKKYLFKESLLLNPTEEVCYNILKHDPQIFTCHKKEVDVICCTDSVSLKRVHSKLRVYWAQTLALEWKTAYCNRLTEPRGHKALIRGLAVLSSQKEFLEIIQKFEPAEAKINWSGADDILLSLRKQIAKYMYISRPQPPPDCLLNYAKGNYLQFVLPSLHSILNNLSSTKSQIYIPKFLDAPVSLQKHGIHLAFEKLKPDAIKILFSDIWKTNKNASIRTSLFRYTYKLLCKEQDKATAKELWLMLCDFIDNLTIDENKIIYTTLSQIKDVPEEYKGEYCMKSYTYLKSLPAKTNCENIITRVIGHMSSIMEKLDPSFVVNIILEFLESIFIKKKITYADIDENSLAVISTFLLSSSDEEGAEYRYEKVMIPLIDRCITLWDKETDDVHYIKYNFEILHIKILQRFSEYMLVKKMFIPNKMFGKIVERLEKSLPLLENYKTLRSWKLTAAFLDVLNANKTLLSKINSKDFPRPYRNYYGSEEKFDEVYLGLAPDFGKICLQYLMEDINLFFPSIYIIFNRALRAFFDGMQSSTLFHLEVGQAMLCNEQIESYLILLKILPTYTDDKLKAKITEIRKIMYSHPSTEVKVHYLSKFYKIE